MHPTAESESAPDPVKAREQSARDVLEAYEFTKWGAELPPLSAFGHVPDHVDLTVAKSKGAQNADGNARDETTLSALLLGLHRRVLCRVTFRGKDDGIGDYENPG